MLEEGFVVSAGQDDVDDHEKPHFLKLPYPFVLMDILGLGESSKPTDASLFRYKQQADSYVQILDHEGVKDNVIPIGHDWYSTSILRASRV